MSEYAVLTAAPEDGSIVHDPTTGTTTQGDTIAGALPNLREAVGLYLEEFPSAPDPALGPVLY